MIPLVIKNMCTQNQSWDPSFAPRYAHALREFGEETSERFEHIPAHPIVIEDDVQKRALSAFRARRTGKVIRAIGGGSGPLEVARSNVVRKDGGPVWRRRRP
jgi:hypothetical protein